LIVAIEGWGGVLLSSPAEGWVVVRWSIHDGGEVVAIYSGGHCLQWCGDHHQLTVVEVVSMIIMVT